MKSLQALLALALFLPAPSGTVTAGARICVDPGHPSETSAGDEVLHGITEVHAAWVVSVRLRSILEAKGFSVTMTKSREAQLVRNRDRARIANDAGAELMVRLHCDTSAESGFAVYYPDRQGRNAGVVGPSREVIARSHRAAEAIHVAMARALRPSLHDCGVRGDSRTKIGETQGALTGSIHSTVPIVTIEMVVLSRKSDADFIASPPGQTRMAEAIAAGIESFVTGK